MSINIRRSFFIAYIIIIISSFFVKSPSWFSSFMVAPLFWLLPMGLGNGLLVISRSQSIFKEKLGYTSQHIFSYFLGTVVLSQIFYLLEKFDLIKHYFSILALALLVISLFFLWRELPNIKALKEWDFARFDFLLLNLVYCFYFFYFSSYPFIDIFQEIHFLKGALELDKFSVLNIYTADSYIPILQVKLAILRRLFAFDLLKSQWIIPYFSLFFNGMIVHTFFSELVSDKFLRKVSTAVVFILLPTVMFSNTNGNFVFLLSILLLSFLFRFRDEFEEKIIKLSFFSFSVLIVFFLFKLIRLNYGQTLILTLISLTGSFIVAKKNTLIQLFMMFVLSISIALPAHRGSLLYFPTILFIFYTLTLIRRFYGDKVELRSILSSRVFFSLGLFLGVSGGLVALGLLHEIYAAPDVMNVVKVNLLKLSEFLLNKKFDFKATQEVGNDFLNSIIELIRAFPIIFHLILLFSVLAFLSRKINLLKMDKENFSNFISTYILFLIIYFVFLFIPMPFLYRGQVYIIFIAILGINASLFYQLKEINFNLNFVIKILCVALMGLLLIESYFLRAFRFEGVVNQYLVRAFPVIATLYLISFILLAFILVAKKKVNHKKLILSFFLSLILIGRVVIVVKFFERSYGQNFVNGKIISHYSQSDLDIAKVINQLPGDEYILFSDPITSSNVKAFTGYNSLFTYANLMDMNKKTLLYWRKNIQILLDKDNKVENNFLSGLMVKFEGRFPESEYYFNKKGFKLSKDNILKSLLVIVNAKTVLWSTCTKKICPYNYFPLGKKLELSFKDRLRTKFKVVYEDEYQMLLAVR